MFKNAIPIILFLLTGQIMILAQTISYQGIARNAQGAPLGSTSIAIRLSIKNESGGTMYRETKSVTTNAFGLYSVAINDGTGSREGTFNMIDWARPTSIQTEIDPANGTAFTDMGTSLMQSVPSAIVAKNLEGVSNPQDGDMLVYKNNQWQKKPAKKFYKKTGFGISPSTTMAMLTNPAVIRIDHSNPILRITALRMFGSTQTGGGTGLNLTLGYRRIDIANQPFRAFDEDSWNTGFRVPIGTRSLITYSGNYMTDLPAGEYEIGIIGQTTSETSTASWDANGKGTVTVEVEH